MELQQQAITPDFQEMVFNKISSILLFGTESSLALSVIRNLGSALPNDILIHSLSFDKGSSQLPIFSKYLDTHYYLKSTREEELVQELRKRINETGATVMLPVDESYVRMLSGIKSRLEKDIYIPPLPSQTLFDSLVHKNRLHNLLQKLNFPNAKTYSLDELNIAGLSSHSFPFILKPVHGSSGEGIKKIGNRKELSNSIAAKKENHYIVQEFIPGQDIGCSLLAIDGRIKAFTIQKGLEKKGFSFSTAVKFENNQAVYKSAERLIKLTGYSGIANLDYRLDSRNGQPKLIDFNARFWSSLLGSKAAGVDFVFLSCLASMGIPFEKPQFYENTYLMGSSTFNYYRRKILNFHSPPSVNTTYTDFWHRFFDPLPEVVRYTNRLFRLKAVKGKGQSFNLSKSS